MFKTIKEAVDTYASERLVNRNAAKEVLGDTYERALLMPVHAYLLDCFVASHRAVGSYISKNKGAFDGESQLVRDIAFSASHDAVELWVSEGRKVPTCDAINAVISYVGACCAEYVSNIMHKDKKWITRITTLYGDTTGEALNEKSKEYSAIVWALPKSKSIKDITDEDIIAAIEEVGARAKKD